MLLAACLTATACGAGGESPRSAATTTVTGAQSACPAAGSHTVEGGRLYVPSGARAGRTPLLVLVSLGVVERPETAALSRVQDGESAAERGAAQAQPIARVASRAGDDDLSLIHI